MKQLTILILLLFSTFVAFSQVDSTQRHAGKNVLTFSMGLASYEIFGSQVDLEASAPGSKPETIRNNAIRVDIGYKRLLSRTLYVGTGLSLVQKGGSQTGTGFVDYAKLDMTYLQMPVSIGIQGMSQQTRGGLEAGAGLNLVISGYSSTANWISTSHHTNSLVPSIMFGTFMETRVNEKHTLSIRFVYEIDMQSAVERTNSAGKTYDIRTQGFSLTVGFQVSNSAEAR